MAIYTKTLNVNYTNGVTTLSLSDGTPITAVTFDDGQGNTGTLQVYNRPRDIPADGNGITVAEEAHTVFAPLVATSDASASHLIVRSGNTSYAVGTSL